MSFDKAIKHKKEKRKKYRGSKQWDSSCRNHGSCGYCENTRTYFDKKARQRLDGQEEEYFNHWALSCPDDATQEALERLAKEQGYTEEEIFFEKYLDYEN